MPSITICICLNFYPATLVLRTLQLSPLLQSRSRCLQCQSHLNSWPSYPHLPLSYSSDLLGKALCLFGSLYQTTFPPDIYTAHSVLSSRLLLQHQILKKAYFNEPTENCIPSTYTSNSPHSEFFYGIWILIHNIIYLFIMLTVCYLCPFTRI